MDVERELDRLYSAALADFIKERDALVRQAKSEGDDDAVGSIKKLAKPSVAAWAINQLARRKADVLGELLAVRDELEHADSPGELRSLSGRRRQLVARLTSVAKDILTEAGHGTSQTTIEKISQGLLATGAEEDRDLLRRGRLTREPTASGLDAFGIARSGETAEEPALKVPLKKQREVERLRRDAERLHKEAARLAHEADVAEEHARRARAKADEAARAAEDANERAIAAME